MPPVRSPPLHYVGGGDLSGNILRSRACQLVSAVRALAQVFAPGSSIVRQVKEEPCPSCGADKAIWVEVFGEEHRCPIKML